MNITLAAVRTVATGAITALAVLPLYEPSWTWIPAAIAMAGAIGIHAVPSIGQVSTITVNHNVKDTAVTDGPTLMGITPPPVPSLNPEPAAPEPVVTETPEPIAETPEPIAEAAEDTSPPTAKELLSTAIAALQGVAQLL